MMMRVRYITIIMVALVSSGSGLLSGQSKSSKQDFIETENFGIQKRPITNRDYIIFICWNINVYGQSYPEKVFDMLPGKENENVKGKRNYEDLLRNPGTLLTNYILNPGYIDYPLTGLSTGQVAKIQKWLSDRYNENLLLKLGYLNFTPDQRNSDCFTLESYLADQYIGSIRNGRVIRWNENMFLATFRLPEQHELDFLALNSSEQNIIKEYKFKKSDYLSLWNDYYISEDKFGTTLHVTSLLDMTFPKNMDREVIQAIDKNETEAIMKYPEDQFIHREYFDETTSSVKDKYGEMSFVIIGENDSDLAIVASINQEAMEQPIQNKIYRSAYHRKIEFDDWPKPQR